MLLTNSYLQKFIKREWFTIPAGNLTTVEKHQRLTHINNLKEEGKSDQQIADTLGISIQTVKRNIKYLEGIYISDLTPEAVTKKRSELEVEFRDLYELARKDYESYRETEGKEYLAKDYMYVMMSAIEKIAKLYGLDNVRHENFTQINSQTNYIESANLSKEEKNKIADVLVGKL